MPWFPDFVGAVQLVRAERRAAGRDDPVGRYFAALNDGDPGELEAAWSGTVVVHDPRAGEIRGHRELRRFVRANRSWMAEHHVTTDLVATTTADGRAVAELLATVEEGGQALAWPVAVVAESPTDDDVVFRTYCSQWPVDGRRHLRPPILESGAAVPSDVVARYLAALTAGDVEAIVGTFAPDGYLREFVGARSVHAGTAELRSYFACCFSDGGIGLEPCAVTDDGVRCAVEYNVLRWGGREVPAQAGIVVFERGPDGLLTAVRSYDDVEPLGSADS